VSEPSRPFRIGIGLALALASHVVAELLYRLLAFEDESAAIPGWATLLIHFGGREAVRAVFVLAATLWAFVGMIEHADEGRLVIGRAIGLIGGAVVATFAWFWFAGGHPVLGSLGALAAIPGVLGPPRARKR